MDIGKFLLLPLFATVLYANQPSFDCSKVEKESTESIICASDTLMRLDNQLSKLYKEALPKAKKEDMLKATQRGWIKSRNECWKSENEKKCIDTSYRLRMDELKRKYSSTIPNVVPEKYTFEKTVSLQGITFNVTTIGEGSLRQMSIIPTGLEVDNSVITQEIDGEVIGVEIADINSDGSPEIYIFTTSAGSGSYGGLAAYSANHKKSLSSIYLPEIDFDSKEGKGYMGHDKFTIIKKSLVRRFPIYKEHDNNTKPTGGTRELEYRLKEGEASWQLKLVKTTEY